MSARRIQIGKSGWAKELKELTGPLGADFWSGFTPVAARDMLALQHQIGRKLPDDFIEFYCTLGCGKFPQRIGGFDTPDEIAAILGAPIYFVLGSLFPGKEWGTADQHRELWLSRGAVNPAPSLFTRKALRLGNIALYDLMQFGSDGMGCYHQLHVGPEPRPFAYCLLTDSQEIEDRASTFSEAVETIVEHHLDYGAAMKRM